MIQVIKHGNLIKSSKCDRCGCEFTYLSSDIGRFYERKNSYESSKLFDYISCPECHHKIKL